MPVHTSRMAMEAVHECEYELLSHRTYSPDFSQAWIRKQQHIWGWRFEADDKLTSAVESWLGNQDAEFYQLDINDWQTRWNKWSWKGTILKNEAVYRISPLIRRMLSPSKTISKI